MSVLMGQQAIQDVNRIPVGVSPQQALKAVEESGYAVVADARGPVSLVVPEDLRMAVEKGATSLLHPSVHLPPTILALTESEIEDVAGGWSYELTMSEGRGAIVLGERGIEGVVPSEELKKYLETEGARRAVDRIWNTRVNFMLESGAALSGPLLSSLGATTGLATGEASAGRDTGGATLGGTIEIGTILRQCGRCSWPNELMLGRRGFELSGMPLPDCKNPDPPKHKFEFHPKD